MKNHFLIWTLACMTLVSCSSVTMTGQNIKETRSHSGFDGVSLSIPADVILEKGNQESVVIEADKSVMEIIETEVKGKTLVIKNRNNYWRDLGQVRIYITATDLNSLTVTGSGNITCDKELSTEYLTVNISGSGSVHLSSLSTTDISTVITGSGNIYIAGADNEKCRLKTVITGSGSMKAEDIGVGFADINITGSGTARINVLNDLETNITGSGSVYYKGNPIVNATATGSGRTRSIN